MVITGELTALEAAYRTVFVGAVNMMGTMVMVMIAILALLLKEGYLVDICLIYAMISFLAVIVLTKVYMGVHKENENVKEEQENGDH